MSALCRLKLWTHSTMTEYWLSGLAMLLLHRDNPEFISSPEEIYERKLNWRHLIEFLQLFVSHSLKFKNLMIMVLLLSAYCISGGISYPTIYCGLMPRNLYSHPQKVLSRHGLDKFT